MITVNDPVETFRVEARELFEQLEATLLDIEANPSDKELIDSAFRALHTIKGSGAMFGFDAASAFTHHVENAFDLVRKGKLAVSGELVEIALAANDHIRTLIETPEAAASGRGESLLSRLATVVGIGPVTLVPAIQAANAASAPAERATYRIHFGFPREALASGTNPLLLLKEMSELGDFTVVTVTDEVPPLEEIDPSGCYLSWDCVLSTDHPRSAIDDVFLFVIDTMDLRVQEVRPESKLLGKILVERNAITPDALDRVLDLKPKLGAALVEDGLVSGDVLAAALSEQKHLRGEEKKANKDSTDIRVQAEKLDELMDQVGELVIAEARLRQLANAGNDSQLKSLVEDIERLSSGLRDTTMGIRMVPIGSLFGRFRRLVRDLSRELGKEIRLTTSGEETEMDKTVIERLHDPLVHLIRNSVDHGIASPAEREAVGKPGQGNIHLSAIHSGAQVLISIKDDGRGIDPAKVRAKAEETGLIEPGAEMSTIEIFQLILQPGFSTADKVTSVSGRGVGMDVVKRSIDSLRGTIDISSSLGAGSEITLRLPLTLAIIEGLLVRVGDSRYVIPLSAVEECVELSAADDARSTGRDFLNIRDMVVPFIRLKSLLKVRAAAEPFQKVVVVSAGDMRVGLVVDQIIGDYQTVIKSLSKFHCSVQTFSGATILGDGTVALILDIPHLIDLGQALETKAKAS